MSQAAAKRPLLVALSCLLLGSCGGGGDGGGTPSPVAVANPGTSPSPGNPPAANPLPPAPFGLASNTSLAIVGWQQTSRGTEPPVLALAEQKGALAWSESLKTYTISLADLGSGSLRYTFPGNNRLAFSIVQSDGSIAKAYVTLIVRRAHLGEIYWQTADGVTPFIYAHGIYGVPMTGGLPSSGRRVFTTDTSPQSAIVFDFATGKVSGTVTAFHDGGGWDPAGPKEQATLEPADIQPDGSFVAALTIPGAPKKGELRGRLFGPAGEELGVYWNAPVRDGYEGAFADWRTVMTYPLCTACSG